MSSRQGFVASLLFTAALAVSGCGTSPGGSGSLPESSAAEFRQQLEQPGLVLAKFGAPWCPPCREVDRELATMAASGESRAEIVTINVDDEPGLAKEYQISSIPRIMLFQNGSKVKDHLGYAGRDQMESWIRVAVGNAKTPEIRTNPLADS